jgi:DNA polymerase-3 subunit delta'
MIEVQDIPQPDRVEGAPHPRETSLLRGQDEAEAAFLEAYTSGRLHHAWLLTGPRGVGKATLAWRIARFLLTAGTGDTGGFFEESPSAPASLDAPRDHPALQRILALAEPRLFLLRRGWDSDKERLKTVITVDEVRKLKRFFELSATDGGRRVVIVDAADEMNTNAANALLKLLEEPPPDSVMLLVSHQPSALLPTIRSRCRALRCRTLSPGDMADAIAAAAGEVDVDPVMLAELSGGSVGEALRLLKLDGGKLYGHLVSILGEMPRMDRQHAIALAETAVGRGAEARFDLLIRLVTLMLARLARTGAAGPPPTAAPGEAEILARLCPGPEAARAWAELEQELSDRMRHGQAVNLDPAALILDTMLRINDRAARLAAG